ncbi:MAG: D-tyrosyl-tRNA(Tyr) deacylase [Puniceicoccaceae bacterium]|nr:MAG: D-tyrosyl-tRNA(Tyr) deacylase [Puniceicoccaceae bacterium]
MKAVVQRVTRASVTVDGKVVGSIGRGLLILLGIHREDTEADGDWICGKVARLRLFENEGGPINASLSEVGGRVLVVSQFTLLASTRKGNRPSFNDAAPPDHARALCDRACRKLEQLLGSRVEQGVFAAHMIVELVNDGPVTITLDSRNRE